MKEKLQGVAAVFGFFGIVGFGLAVLSLVASVITGNEVSSRESSAVSTGFWTGVVSLTIFLLLGGKLEDFKNFFFGSKKK